jgi:hypothetical protein
MQLAAAESAFAPDCLEELAVAGEEVHSRDAHLI